MLLFENNGPDLVQTNYWDTEAGQAGYFFLSWNAGHARLLTPEANQGLIEEMGQARMAILSLGSLLHMHDRQGIEILFEDDSLQPLAVTIAVEQCDRDLRLAPEGGGFDFTVWCREGKQLALPGKFRIVPSLPCRDAWKEC